MAIMEIYLTYLQSMNVRLSDTLAADHVHALGLALEDFEQRKFIEQFPIDTDRKDPLYMVNEDKRPAMEYYKNNCVCFFVPAAYTALAILELDAFQFSSIELHKSFEFLRYFFGQEFILQADKTAEHFIQRSIDAFLEINILIPHETCPGQYNLTSEGLRKLKLFTAFLMSYLESYLIVLTLLKQEKQISDEKEMVKKILQHGRRMYKHNEIELLEAVSKITLKNAFDFFSREKILNGEDKTKADFYEDKIQKYLTLLA